MLGSGRVLQTFYSLRSKAGGPPEPKCYYKRCWNHADAYLKWCEKNGVDDPLAFLHYRFETAAHGGYVPKLHQLRSVALATIWKEWREGVYLAARQGEKLVAAAGTAEQQLVKHLRVLTRGQEAAKQPYFQNAQSELCLAESSITGGYHPSSRYCPSCPAATRCAAKLYQQHGFDVVGLRAGRLDRLPADIAAAAVR